MSQTGQESVAHHLSYRLRRLSGELAGRWLDRLSERVHVASSTLYPSTSLLDGTRSLIDELGRFIATPKTVFAPNEAVVATAREIGMVRLSQHCSVQQILREFDQLSEILGAFVLDEVRGLAIPAGSYEVGVCLRRLYGGVAVLTQVTVDTVFDDCADRITDQSHRLNAFKRLASHGRKGPLGAIRTSVALMRAERAHDSTACMQRLAVIERNATRLDELLEQIADLTQARAGSEPVRQHLPLARVANDVAQRLSSHAAQRGVTIDVDPALPDVPVDAIRMDLILTNLLSNALKYSDPAKPTRVARVSFVEMGHSVCVIEIRDNGLGMTPEQARYAFAPFYRGHSHLDGELRASGDGLGLAVVRDCVRAIGARIALAAAQKEGTVFRLVLPVAPET